MKYYIAAFAAVATLSLAAEPSKPTVAVPQPIAGIAITQCSLLVVAYIVTADEKLIHYTQRDGLPLARVLQLVRSARQHEVADLPCDQSQST